jgi:hypothetical protein
MSPVDAKLAQALFPLLITALLAAGCSDSTAPSDRDGGAGAERTEEPDRTSGSHSSTAPAERAPGSDVLNPSAGAGISAAIGSTGSFTNAYCYGEPISHRVRVLTQAGVPFKYTGSGSTERVWFRANFWSQGTYLGSSEWFYTDLAPGQQSGTGWYRSTTGQWGAWQADMPFSGSRAAADMEYQWYQNGRLVAQQLTRATHIVSSSSTGATGGADCYWAPKWNWVWVPLLPV